VIFVTFATQGSSSRPLQERPAQVCLAQIRLAQGRGVQVELLACRVLRYAPPPEYGGDRLMIGS
jgi:hypothetical protein